MSMTTQEQETEKKYKLPPEVREYHKQKRREKRGNWKCARCGSLNPTVLSLEKKEKLCDSCDIQRLKEKVT